MKLNLIEFIKKISVWLFVSYINLENCFALEAIDENKDNFETTKTEENSQHINHKQIITFIVITISIIISILSYYYFVGGNDPGTGEEVFKQLMALEIKIGSLSDLIKSIALEIQTQRELDTRNQIELNIKLLRQIVQNNTVLDRVARMDNISIQEITKSD